MRQTTVEDLFEASVYIILACTQCMDLDECIHFSLSTPMTTDGGVLDIDDRFWE